MLSLCISAPVTDFLISLPPPPAGGSAASQPASGVFNEA